MELESEQRQQQKKNFSQCPGTFFTTNPDFSDSHSRVTLSVKHHLDGHDTGLLLLCNPIFAGPFLPPPSIFSPSISYTSP